MKVVLKQTIKLLILSFKKSSFCLTFHISIINKIVLYNNFECMRFRKLFILCTLSSGQAGSGLFKAAMIFTLMCSARQAKARRLHFLQTALMLVQPAAVSKYVMCWCVSPCCCHVPSICRHRGRGAHLLHLPVPVSYGLICTV